MSQLCPWDLSKLEYDGLCSHIPFLEAVAGDFSLSPEELEVQAAQVLANRAERKSVASRAVYAQALANDPEALHAKGRATYRKHVEENPASVKAAWGRSRAKGKESRKWYCAICDHACDKQVALTRHLQSTKHHQRASRHCAICKNTFCKKSKYEQHLKSVKHAKAVKLALSLTQSTLEGFLPSSTATSKTSTQSSLWGFLRSS
jgi:hypothetical protein